VSGAVAARSRTPSVAELRAVVQPEGVMARGEEHWMGRLYMRRVSPYATLALLRTPATPNAVTWLMLVAGVAAGAVLGVAGAVPPFAAAALVQLQLLLDCCDGELARWLDRRSTAGVYVDHLAHWLTEAALPIGLGVRADGGWHSLGGWTTLGLVTAVLVLLVKAETVLVHVARAESGLPPVRDSAEVAAPRASGLARLRRVAGRMPLFRAFVAMEFTLLALAAAIADTAAGDLTGTRVLAGALVPLAALVAVGHLLAILTSSRLR
jgi:phosphatidylglycerophosphate synthase